MSSIMREFSRMSIYAWAFIIFNPLSEISRSKFIISCLKSLIHFSFILPKRLMPFDYFISPNLGVWTIISFFTIHFSTALIAFKRYTGPATGPRIKAFRQSAVDIHPVLLPCESIHILPDFQLVIVRKRGI